MICWGDNNCCGIFTDRAKDDRCACLRDRCLRDFTNEQKILVNEDDLEGALDHLFAYEDDNMHELDTALSLRSIAASSEYQMQTKQLIDRLAQRLRELEFEVEMVELEPQDGGPTHYVIFANYFSTPAKNVVLVHGHVDVLPVEKDDGWTQEPFKLTQLDGQLFGRGVATSKGPVLCWLQAAHAWLEQTKDLPVNLRFIIDTSVNGNNRALRETIAKHKAFFAPVDLLISTTNLWITDKTPMITTSQSGYVHFELEVKEEKQQTPDESAQPGKKAAREPMAEMCLLMNTLTDGNTAYLKEGLMRHVLPVTQRDWDLLCKAEVGIMEYKDLLDVKRLRHEQSKPMFLKHRWCMPDLVMHSVSHSQFSSQRDLHSPPHIVARFSVKLVPDQSVEYVSFVIREYLDSAYRRLKCEHPAHLRVLDSLSPLNEARSTPFNIAASRAYDRVFHARAAIPDTIHTCMPTINELRKYCRRKAQVLCLPFCSIHTYTGMPDESISRDRYLKNQALFATIMYEVALLPPDCKCSDIKKFCLETGKMVNRDFTRLLDARNPTTSHVLYELDESQIDRSPAIHKVLPTVNDIILGDQNERKLE